jgi:hypothetical protein
VRAGDGDRIAEAHQLREHFCALYDRHQRFAGGRHLGVAVVHGARHDHGIRVANVFLVVPDEHGRTLRLEPLDRRIAFEVRALYAVTEAQHHFRDAGHAGAADADEMHTIDSSHALDHVVAPAASRQ